MINQLKKIWPVLRPDRSYLVWALGAILINSFLNLGAPALLGYGIDHFVASGDYPGLLHCCLALVLIYLAASQVHYRQTLWMGTLGQRLLFRLRAQLFEKLQELPVAFFQRSLAGDLISRLNNDTDKVNQFFSQSLVQFVGSMVTMVGAGAFLLFLHPQLGGATLVPAIFLLLFTRAMSPWIRRRNAESLKSAGELSAEVAECLDHFKVLVAFHRRDYFLNRFGEINRLNFSQTLWAGLANSVFSPIYNASAQLAQLVVLAYGGWLVSRHQCTLGLLISFLLYIQRFYDPLRQLANLWANFQGAMAGWERISAILNEDLHLPLLPAQAAPPGEAPRLELREVHFGYDSARTVLHEVNLRLLPGKTYALVGPTGGGKTTIASLMARLYDPTRGSLWLDGCDLRSYTPEQRSQKIGFILQEPFLFEGTLRDNAMTQEDIEPFLERFPEGLDSKIEGLSLGQRQIVAFLRAVRRKPELLILDEATANIDTVTEAILQGILADLPATTTRVIIAHRLNTIQNADEIYFVNNGVVELAGSLDQALTMLRDRRRQS